MTKNTTATLAEMKQRGEKISQLTCYDYTTARLVDAAGITRSTFYTYFNIAVSYSL